MGALSIISQLVKALAENSAQPKTGAQQHIRPVPVEQLKLLLKNGRKQDAVLLLSNTMNWSGAKSLEFVEALQQSGGKTNTNIHQNSISRKRTATQIDAILREQQQHENKGGGSLLDFLKSKFGR